MKSERHLPSLWYCLEGRETATVGGCNGGPVDWFPAVLEFEVAELAGVAGLLCSGVAAWCAPLWYPKKSPNSGTHTLSYMLPVGTFSRVAFAASTSGWKTEQIPQFCHQFFLFFYFFLCVCVFFLSFFPLANFRVPSSLARIFFLLLFLFFLFFRREHLEYS